MQLQVSTCYAGDRNQWCFRRYFQSTHTTLVGLGALDEKPPLLFSHGLRINIQACKQLEGSYYSSRYNPVCARSLLCQTVSLYAHQPVNILLVLCHHGPWTVCEHFYYKISQLQPFFMRPKKKKNSCEIRSNFRVFQSCTLYDAYHIIVGVARSRVQSCLDYHIYRWLQSCIVCCCAGFKFLEREAVFQNCTNSWPVSFFFFLCFRNL